MAGEQTTSLLPFDPTQKVFSLFDEFKRFAFKGNVIDLAVGVIIGSAFGKIVNSMVTNIIMPFVAVVMPGKDGYADWKLPVSGQEIPIGLFLADVVDFLIVAAVLFVFIVKFLGWLMQAKKAQAVVPPAPPPQEVLLTEIRDLLKQQLAQSPSGN